MRMGLFQEMHQDCLNGFDEKVEEWEEIEFLVDSGASATVVNTSQVGRRKYHLQQRRESVPGRYR